MPASPALVYLVIGMAIGPWGFGWLRPDPEAHHVLLERAAEIAVLVSLFATGSAIGTTMRVTHWRVPVRLATVGMLMTVILLAGFAHWAFNLSWGASLVLAGALAPTDPVLAGDVQVADERDRDRLRFGLTGEAGLNDGAAFPIVLAGLAVLGVEQVASDRWGTFALGALWGVVGGLALGALLGTVAGRWVARRLRDGVESETTEAFLGLGIVAVSYGVALLIDAYGFLAVFAAAVSLRYSLAGEGGKANESVDADTAFQRRPREPVRIRRRHRDRRARDHRRDSARRRLAGARAVRRGAADLGARRAGGRVARARAAHSRGMVRHSRRRSVYTSSSRSAMNGGVPRRTMCWASCWASWRRRSSCTGSR
jgi:hypothetical protein